MPFLFSMRIGARLALAFGAVLLLLAGLSGVASVAIQGLASSADVLYTQRTQPLVVLARVDALLGRNRMLVMDMLIDPGTANIQKRSTELNANIGLAQAAWANYRSSDKDPSETKLEQVKAFEALLDAYLKTGLVPAALAASEERYDDTVAAYSDHIGPLAPQVESAMAKLTAQEVAQAQAEFEQVQQVAQGARGLVWAGAALALLLGTWLAWAITRSVTQPLHRAVTLADAIAHGDLRAQPRATGRDECADLLRALDGMCAQLREVVKQVRDCSDTVAAGATDVTHGTADLSRRTEEQAAQLEDTRTTVVGLIEMDRQVRETALQANGLVSQASQDAQGGGTAVHQVVQTMQDISASSNRIGDIIGLIDGIAFQTNILALNAAVEAARAGEHGRGFAVVAQEVRQLAQRSAQAAREIKTLINNSIVQVASGAQQVRVAGEKVGGIVAQISSVRSLIDDLYDASEQQNRAVEHIAATVGQLDQTTQSNASLAEQSRASADSLREQAQRLIAIVGTFQLGQERDRPAVASLALAAPGGQPLPRLIRSTR